MTPICLLFSSYILAYIYDTGTHVAGIIAANATGMNQTGYVPYMPFVGVAPQATLGACKFSFSVIKKSVLSIRSSVWMHWCFRVR